MSKLLPPDWIALASPLVLVGVSVGIIIIFIDDNPNVKVGLTASVSCIPGLAAFLWQSSGIRVLFFRFYYRYFGPNCVVRILGEIPVNADQSDKELLDKAVRAMKLGEEEPELVAEVGNRRVVLVAKRHLTIDALTVDMRDEEMEVVDWEGEEEGIGSIGDSFEGMDLDRRLVFNLLGYEGKLTKVDSLLRAEVPVLLERLNDNVKVQGALCMFSLRATIEGENPFLVFYLKDVPTRGREEFTLKLVSGEGDSQVVVGVSLDSIDVSARTPSRLMESASRYLASPALGRG